MGGAEPLALVSNAAVCRFRLVRKGLLILFLSVCVLLSLALTLGQIEQHIFRRQAELLLSEVQSLELRQTPWHDAQTQFQHWGVNREFDDSCNEHRCSLKITLKEFVFGYVSRRNNMFVDLDDYFRWRLKLSYNTGPFERALLFVFRAYMRMGGRPANVIANVGMRDGIVWGKGISVWIETYESNIPGVFGGWSGEYTLIADAHSVPRFDYFDGQSLVDAGLMLHANYVIGRPGGCEICVMGWAKFTPYALPADIHRLMQLDLSCLTRRHPCHEQTDIMPVAWTQYISEHPPGGASLQPECSASEIEMLGRDSANITTGEITGYKRAAHHNSRNGVATVRVLGRLKGTVNWNVGDTREVSLDFRPGVATPKIGSLWIFVGGSEGFNDIRNYPVDSCPSGIPLDETNMTLIRQGIEQDYSRLDRIK